MESLSFMDFHIFAQIFYLLWEYWKTTNVFEIFAKISFWPLNLGPSSKVMAPNESPYLVSYMSIIERMSLSLIVFEIFAKIAFWPPDLGPRSKVMAPTESPYLVSYMSFIVMMPPSLIIFEIFAKIAFWPRDLGPRSNVIALSVSPYMDSYMSIIELKSLISNLSLFSIYLRQ